MTNSPIQSDKWIPYVPVLSSIGEGYSPKPVELFYRQGVHIIKFVYEYKLNGKKVDIRGSWKRLSVWDSVKFLVKRKLGKDE